MTQDRLPRKLAAILYGDVTGYSRLTGADEDATHRRLSAHLDLFAATIKRHRGRVMHYAGDAVLAQFSAVVDALICATDVQREIAIRNRDVPPERRVEFGIGVNLGDVIEDRGDIYGDGVNTAARLEGLAGPGEICISDAVRVAVGKRLALDYDDLGEQTLKNIDHSVRVYRIRALAASVAEGGGTFGAVQTETDDTGRRRDSKRRKLLYAIAGALGVVTALSVIATSYFHRNDSARAVSNAAATDLEHASMAAPSIIPLTFDGGEKIDPQLSPDGEMVAFSWTGPNDDNMDVYVKPIGRDTQAIRITNDPALDGQARWSPDGKQLAFLHLEKEQASIYVVPALGGQPTKLIDLESRPIYGAQLLSHVAWSPDSRVLAYHDRPSAGAAARIIQFDLDTRETRALSTPPAGPGVMGDFEPAFSPRGDRIAFVRSTASFGSEDIWIMDAHGGNEQRLTSTQFTRVNTLSWTPDGREVLFTAGTIDLRSYSVRLEDGTPRPLPGLGNNDVSANTAGQRLVFARVEAKALRMWQAPGRLAKDRRAAPRDLAREGIKLVFSPRGDKIAWQGHRTGRAQIWIADPDGANAHALTDARAAASPDWSPDGRRIAFYSSDAGNNDVYVVDIASRLVRPLTTDKAEDRYPKFSRDGRWVYFSSNRSGQFKIYKMLAEGGDAVLAMDEPATFAVESYDGRYLYYEFLEDNLGFTGDAPVWRIPVDRKDRPTEVLPAWPRIENSWVLTRGGIYYRRADVDPGIKYRDLIRGTDIDIVSGGGMTYPGVSLDEEAVFFSRDAPPQAELWLVENFR